MKIKLKSAKFQIEIFQNSKYKSPNIFCFHTTFSLNWDWSFFSKTHLIWHEPQKWDFLFPVNSPIVNCLFFEKEKFCGKEREEDDKVIFFWDTLCT